MRIPRRRLSTLWQLGCPACLCLLAAVSLHAQVIRDGTLGNGPRGELLGSTLNITPDMGERFQQGKNIFHSFEKFDLQSGRTADFKAEGASNILARITDRSPSSINGTVKADANLFLMNPAGIMFGASAKVDVTGSFFATTADYIKLGTDGSFSANPAAGQSVLTVSDPSAFGFLTPNPAAIAVNGSRLNGAGLKTLAFVGGDVSISNRSILAAQDVQIVSVRSAGEATLRLPSDTNGLRYPVIDAESFPQHGAVSVGTPSIAGQPPSPGATITGSRVVIRGGTLVISKSTVEATAAAPGDGTFVKTSGSINLSDFSAIQSFNTEDLRGVTTVDVAAGSVTATFGSQISTLTYDPASGGNLRLTVSGALKLESGSTIMSDTDSSIVGGDLFISAHDFELRSATVLSQSAFGKSGDIHIDVTGALTIVEQSSVAVGVMQAAGEQIIVNAGEILISGRRAGINFGDFSIQGTGATIKLAARGKFSILDGGQVLANTAASTGADVEVTAGEMLISGQGVEDFSTGILAQGNGQAGTRGGNVRLTIAGTLNVLEGGTISTNTTGEGPGGNIQITAHDINVTGRGGRLTENLNLPQGISAQNVNSDPFANPGGSGGIQLNVLGKLDVRDAGEIVADTHSTGQGGDIDINARDLTVSTKGVIAARTLNATSGGAGGDVNIEVSDRLEVNEEGQITVGTFGSGPGGTISIHGNQVLVSGRGARISAVSGQPLVLATGAGGNLFLEAAQFTLSNDGQVTASTFGPGAGGNVNIVSDALFITDNSETAFAGITAQTLSSGAGGPGGTVQVDTRTLDMRGAGATITTQSLGAGNGGRIQIASETISLRDGSSIQSSSEGTGSAGSIVIGADGDITLNSGSSFSVAATQSDAGDINVRSGTSITLTDSSITAQAALNGGNIDLRTPDMLFLTNSQITAAAGVNGGNIFIDPQFVVLQDSVISANAILGRGGNIRIISNFFLATNSLVTATSLLGIDGTVRIDALNTELTGNLVELPDSLINAESLLQELCTVKVDDFSSFISEGRGGLPPMPGESLPSLMIVR